MSITIFNLLLDDKLENLFIFLHEVKKKYDNKIERISFNPQVYQNAENIYTRDL